MLGLGLLMLIGLPIAIFMLIATVTAVFFASKSFLKFLIPAFNNSTFAKRAGFWLTGPLIVALFIVIGFAFGCIQR